MRGPNFYFPVHNRASVSITPSLYDRRALDCTAVMPLLNSLSHLGVLTITAPRIREVLTTDGGLERLLEIMRSLPIAQKMYRKPGIGGGPSQTVNSSNSTHPNNVIAVGASVTVFDFDPNMDSGQGGIDRNSQAALYEWLWTAAYQCLVHVGVRGTEVIRTRMIKIGVVDFLVSVLKSHIILGQIQHTDRMLGEYMNAVDGVLQYETIKQLQMHHQQQQLQLHQQMQTNLNLVHSADANIIRRFIRKDSAIGPPRSPEIVNSVEVPCSEHWDQAVTSSRQQPHESMQISASNDSNSSSILPFDIENIHLPHQPHQSTVHQQDAHSATTVSASAAAATASAILASSPFYNHPMLQERHKVLSKSIAQSLVLASEIDTNVFARSEDVLHGLNLLGYLTKYLSTREMLNQIKGPDNIFAIVEQFTQPSRGEAMNEKALIVMHNLVRHDNDSVPRRCVNFKCLKQEDKEQGFTLMRCKRCRKARYCSRNCQTDAWRDGHRFWCKERKSSSSSAQPTTATAATTTDTADSTTTTATTTAAAATATTTTNVEASMDTTTTATATMANNGVPSADNVPSLDD